MFIIATIIWTAYSGGIVTDGPSTIFFPHGHVFNWIFETLWIK